MRKLIFLFLMFFSFSSLAQQNWKQVKTENDILVEYTTQELHNNQYDIHQEYYIFRFTNVSNSLVSFSFDITVNGNNYDSERVVSINLPSGESEIGQIGEFKGDELTLFHKFLPNNQGIILSQNQINNFDIQIKLN